MTKEVPVGLGTVRGIVSTVAAGVIAVVQSIQENQALLNGNNKAAGIAMFASAILTMLGRQFQAALKK